MRADAIVARRCISAGILLASVALAGLLAGCKSEDVLPACERACVYDAEAPIVIRVGSDAYTVRSPGADDRGFASAKDAMTELHQRTVARQKQTGVPATPVLHVECGSSVPGSRILPLLREGDAWPTGGKAPARPTALALRGATGAFAAVGFVKSPADASLAEDGTCEAWMGELDEVAKSGETRMLKR